MSVMNPDVIAPDLANTVSLNEVVKQFIRENLKVPETAFDLRNQPRCPSCHRISIEPVVDGWGGLSPEESQPLVGHAKDFSPEGIGFFHTRSIPTRRVVVRLEGADGSILSLLAVLRWCHAIDDEWYLSGGSFVGVVTNV